MPWNLELDQEDNDLPLFASDPLAEERLGSLLLQLQQLDLSQKIWAAEQLGETDDRRAVEPLLAALENPSPELRATAIEALGRLDDHRAIASIIAGLDAPEAGIRAAATGAFPRIREKHHLIDWLCHLLEDPNPEVRQKAAQAWMGRYDPRAIPRLLQCARDFDSYTRSLALAALRHYSDPRILTALDEAARNPHFHIRQRALSELSRRPLPLLVDSCLDYLNDPDPEICRSAILASRYFRNRRFCQPLRQLARASDHRTRATTADALAPYADNPAVLQTLLEMLHDHEPLVRMAAVSAQELLFHPESIDRIRPLREDPDENVRLQVGFTATKFYTPAAADVLSPLLIETTPSLPYLLTDLSGLHVNRLLDQLLALAASAHPHVRAAVAKALRHSEDPRARFALVGLLEDPTLSVAGTAATSLAQSRHPAGVEFLIRCLQSDEPAVREQASESLSGVALPAVIDALQNTLHDPCPSVRKATIAALGEMRLPHLFPVLRHCLENENYQSARAVAAAALGELGNPEAIPALQSCRETSSGWLRCQALLGLALLGDPEAIDLVLHDKKSPRAATPTQFWFYCREDKTDQRLYQLLRDYNPPRICRIVPKDLALPVSQGTVRKAAHQLSLSPEEIRRRYERLADRVNLKLEWRMME